MRDLKQQPLLVSITPLVHSASLHSVEKFNYFPLSGPIVPREPARTSLRFASTAALRSAPSGVRSGTHSCPNVPTRGNAVLDQRPRTAKRKEHYTCDTANHYPTFRNGRRY